MYRVLAVACLVVASPARSEPAKPTVHTFTINKHPHTVTIPVGWRIDEKAAPSGENLLLSNRDSGDRTTVVIGGSAGVNGDARGDVEKRLKEFSRVHPSVAPDGLDLTTTNIENYSMAGAPGRIVEINWLRYKAGGGLKNYDMGEALFVESQSKDTTYRAAVTVPLGHVGDGTMKAAKQIIESLRVSP